MHSITLSEKESQALINEVTKRGLRREQPKSDYELLRVKDGIVFLVLYKSGKLVQNGTDATMHLLESVIERKSEFDYMIGTDETGKGEWYGPLVVVGVCITPDQILSLRSLGTQDSKSLSRIRIQEIGNYIKKSSIIWDTKVLKPTAYNELYSRFASEGKNLNDILAWAHTGIINDILTKLQFNKVRVIIDKFDIKATDLRLGKVKKFNVEIIQKSKGGSEVPVAAASVLAKLIFEEEVDYLNKKYKTDLRKSEPNDIGKDLLPYVAKMHFKNVQSVFRNSP